MRNKNVYKQRVMTYKKVLHNGYVFVQLLMSNTCSPVHYGILHTRHMKENLTVLRSRRIILWIPNHCVWCKQYSLAQSLIIRTADKFYLKIIFGNAIRIYETATCSYGIIYYSKSCNNCARKAIFKYYKQMLHALSIG